MIITSVEANVFLKWFKWEESYVGTLKLAGISLEADKIGQTVGRKPLGAAGEPKPTGTTDLGPPELPLGQHDLSQSLPLHLSPPPRHPCSPSKMAATDVTGPESCWQGS